MRDDVNFMLKLTNGEFTIAFDPLSRCYVSIQRVDTSKKKITIFARRVSDMSTHSYGLFELTRFS